jgi:expansin (peptidoglycan-binding protein)
VRAHKAVVARIDAIDDSAWVDIDYTDRGVAQVAEATLGAHRLIVRRTKITDDPKVLALFPEWRHHASSPTVPATRSSSMPTTARMPSRSW